MVELICFPSFFKALGHPIRQKILNVLNYEGKLTIRDLSVKLDLSTSTVEYHLKVLKEERIIVSSTENGDIYYSIHCQTVHKCCDLMPKIFLESGVMGKSSNGKK